MEAFSFLEFLLSKKEKIKNNGSLCLTLQIFFEISMVKGAWTKRRRVPVSEINRKIIEALDDIKIPAGIAKSLDQYQIKRDFLR